MALFDYVNTPSTPKALHDAYRRLPVDLYDGRSFLVDIHKYRNASSGNKLLG